MTLPLAPRLLLRAYDQARLLDEHLEPLPADGASREFAAWGARWRIEPGDGRFACTLLEGAPPPVAVGVSLPLPDWSREVYTLLPGALYAGNRFPCRAENYSPRHPEADAGPDAAPVIADVPRLAFEDNVPSRVQRLTGDLASPAFAARWPDGRALLLTSPDAIPDALWEIDESDDRRSARFALLTPGVRATRYSFRHGRIRTDHPSSDLGRRLAPGDTLGLGCELTVFHAPEISAVFERLFDFVDTHLRRAEPRPELPLSVACDLVETKRNREDWAPTPGLYRTTNLQPGQTRQIFQTGWCGGIIAESALVAGRHAESLVHAPRSLDTIATRAPRPTGWLAGKAHADGSWTADFTSDDARPWTHRRTLVRRQADALWFLLAAAERHAARTGRPAPSAWTEAARGLADAFCRLWRERGSPGHFIDIDTDRIEVGGSASGALAPAGLCAAARHFNEPRYRQVAAELGDFYHRHFTLAGVTTGGPADALQAPDSESAASLVESFLALHEADAPDGPWLPRARAAAAQLASWVMPYDFPFPADTEFARLGIPTAGAVFANVQNNHAATLCTHGGGFLLRLFRHTGDARLLRLVAAITRLAPHLVSREDRPVHAPEGRALPPGWINERINTGDWDHNVGGVFYGSTWCEVALLLAGVELPSVYAQPDTGVLVCLDHLEAAWAEPDRAALRVRNPTRFGARARLLVETADEARRRPLGPADVLALPVIELAPGETRLVSRA